MSIVIPGQEEMSKYGGVLTPQQAAEQERIAPGRDVENIWNERHDVDATHGAIQEILAGGTPNWVKWPEDYKSFVKEEFAAHKEDSDRMAGEYKWDDQKMLTNKQARQVNPIVLREFVEKKLKGNGINCLVMASDWRNAVGGSTVALWCIVPNTNRLRYVSYMDAQPIIWEWSVLRLDQHGIPSGEESRGWRTVAYQLVEKDIITEKQCHQIFGVPTPNEVSARYYRSLWEKRHNKKWDDSKDQEIAERKQ